MEELCTVLLISYNHVDYIKQAIESVLFQKTCFTFKIHIFDDCSTDGTIDIINEYQQNYPELIKVFISENNLGAQENFWRAYNSVKSKYLACLECDDYWTDDKKLEMQIRAMERHPECSFCGHDTLFITLDDKSREYRDNSNCCTNSVLKDKIIFTYEDFQNVNNGGYIPYVSARLIRTKCLCLSEIKYKESVLFDFTQFYYLLLKGNYYYINKCMSVYQRTGQGVCSGKSPLLFLNTFVQNALDFNKETNFCISDKIFLECQLQIDFRLQLDRNFVKMKRFNNNFEKHKNQLEPMSNNSSINDLFFIQNTLDIDKYYFLCNGGFGHTIIICRLLPELEKKYKSKIYLMIMKEHTVILENYKIKNFIVIDYKNVNLSQISNHSPNPEKGEIFVTHPFAHLERASFYLPILNLTSTVPILNWYQDFFGLKKNADCQDIEYNDIMANAIEADITLNKKLEFLGAVEKIVLFFPESYTLQCINEKVWIKKAQDLKIEGVEVVSCVQNKTNTIRGTIFLDLSVKEIILLAARCKEIHSARNGLCDLLSFLGEKLHVYYPSHAALYIYSLNTLYKRNDIVEEIIIQKKSFNNDILKSPIKPYFFGIFPIPHALYRFYLKHKKALHYLKKFVRWRDR